MAGAVGNGVSLQPQGDVVTVAVLLDVLPSHLIQARDVSRQHCAESHPLIQDLGNPRLSQYCIALEIALGSRCLLTGKLSLQHMWQMAPGPSELWLRSC